MLVGRIPQFTLQNKTVVTVFRKRTKIQQFTFAGIN